MPSVLIVDDEPNIRRMVGALLGAEGYEVRDAQDGVSGLQRALESEPDVLLLDLMMPGDMDGIATLARFREALPDVPVVMMSGRAGLSDAVKATKLGAFNFLEKPLSPEGVLLALSSALELRQARREAKALRADLGLSGEMIGDSPAMLQVRAMIERVAPTDARVLIMGESGTGKELVAAAIHGASPLRERPGDIPALVRHFSMLHRTRTGQPMPAWRDDALATLVRYTWPGNVRELANIIERLSILHPGREVTDADVGAVLPMERTGQ